MLLLLKIVYVSGTDCMAFVLHYLHFFVSFAFFFKINKLTNTVASVHMKKF